MRRGARLLVAFLGLLALPPAAGAQAMTDGLLRAVDVETPAFFFYQNRALDLVWSLDLPDTGARFLRLHLTEIEDRTAADYRVIVFDRGYRPVFQYRKAELSGRPELWTGIIPGGAARVEIRSPMPPNGLRFRIKEYAYQVDLPRLESIFGQPDWTYIESRAGGPGARGVARAIAKLSFIRNGQMDACSGFLISEDRFVTNEHCVSSPDLCEHAVALFGYERKADGSEGWEREARCLQVIDFNSSLDFAVLRLEGEPGRVFGFVKLARRLPVAREPLYVIQHPGGGPKMISQAECAVRTIRAEGYAGDTDFGHTCDTARGSSGSPVFDRMHQVIGIHHRGFIATSTRWKNENRGVRIEQIVDVWKP